MKGEILEKSKPIKEHFGEIIVPVTKEGGVLRLRTAMGKGEVNGEKFDLSMNIDGKAFFLEFGFDEVYTIFTADIFGKIIELREKKNMPRCKKCNKPFSKQEKESGWDFCEYCEKVKP